MTTGRLTLTVIFYPDQLTRALFTAAEAEALELLTRRRRVRYRFYPIDWPGLPARSVTFNTLTTTRRP